MLPARNNDVGGWQLKVSPVDLEWGDGGIQLDANLDWPRRGSMRLQSTNVTGDFFADFHDQTVPPWTVQRANFSARWDEGPLLSKVHMRN